MDNFAGTKRPSINLSLFTTFPGSFSSGKSTKSWRNFEGGMVGLGIVAALTDSNQTHEAFFSAKFSGAAANLSLSPRSSPIPIVSPARPNANFRGGVDQGIDDGAAVEDELSESYTCVISHIGNSSVKKRVYYGDEMNGIIDSTCSAAAAAAAACVVNAAIFSDSPLNFGGEVKREFRASDFLSCCYLCNKHLHGLDIFMYRGEKAFCSDDCRGKHMRDDNRKEKCRSEAMKPLEFSASPCSGPMLFFAGVAAA